MKHAAIGRILLWRGGSLWIGRGGEPADFHSHHAIQITLAFPEGQIRLRGRGTPWISYAAAIVAAQRVHAFDARDQHVAVIFVEPESRDGQVLQHRHRGDGIAELPAVVLAAVTAALAAAFSARASGRALHWRAPRLQRFAMARRRTEKFWTHESNWPLAWCAGSSTGLCSSGRSPRRCTFPPNVSGTSSCRRLACVFGPMCSG